ncbi:unnamed protein product [Dovyalis caffra]|uniref:RRM domain-containing protein n=1 Tax=Dovyalis caffra TaxID=77055 RepID=A0AAV1RAY2_9ROSI|nr:unnamed protein product [Dovyalis caffra]
MSYSRRSRYSLSPPYTRDSRSVSRSLSRSRSSSRDVENPGNNLYVTGLSPRITKKELQKHFAAEGTVIDVHLVVDPWTRESRGFGFVTMSNVQEADRCIKYLDRSVLEGRVITVEKAKRKRGRTPTPGRYLGLRTIRVTLLVDLLATLLIGGARAGHPVIHLNVAGVDPTPHITVDAGHILLITIAVDGTTRDLDPHTAGPLSAGVTGPTHLITQGITHQMTDTNLITRGVTHQMTDTNLITQGITRHMRDTIEDTAIALNLVALLHEGLGGAIHEAFHLGEGGAQGGVQGGATRAVCPLSQGGARGGATRAVYPLSQGEAIHAAYPLSQGGAQGGSRGGVILEVFLQVQGRDQGGQDDTATLGAAVQVVLPDLSLGLSPLARLLRLVESKLRLSC